MLAYGDIVKQPIGDSVEFDPFFTDVTDKYLRQDIDNVIMRCVEDEWHNLYMAVHGKSGWDTWYIRNPRGRVFYKYLGTSDSYEDARTFMREKSEQLLRSDE